MKNAQQVVKNINKKKGVRGGWPIFLNYNYVEESKKAVIQFNQDEKTDGGSQKKNFRRFDCWGFAFVDELINENLLVKKLCFNLNTGESESLANIEALKRRLSYLKFNNPDIELFFVINGVLTELYTIDSLYSRPKNEIVRSDSNISQRDDTDKPGRLEKDFQAFLFGKGLFDQNQEEVERVSDRLALLGEDFFRLKQNLKNKNIKSWLLREFPTGAFDGEVSDPKRILPTEYVDLLSLNKYGQLAVVELKVNDSQLEVMSQLLDYALFFRCYYWEKVSETGCFFKNNVKKNINEFICYVVNNYYHPRFDSVFFQYFVPKDIKANSFKFTKLTLGFGQTNIQ